MVRTRLRFAFWVGFLSLITAAGCGTDELSSPTAIRLKGIANLYMDCAITKDGQGPADEKAFKKHLGGLPDHVIGSNGLDPKAIDAAFVSDRDKEPFVIRYGIKITRITATDAPVVAHEKTGKDGKRLVAFANGKAENVDEARLKELLAAK